MLADPHADQADDGWTAMPGAPSVDPDIDSDTDPDIGVDVDVEPALAVEGASAIDTADDIEPKTLEPAIDEADEAEGDLWFTDAAPAAVDSPQPGAPLEVESSGPPPAGPQSSPPPPADPQPASPQPSGPPVVFGTAPGPIDAPAAADPQPAGPPPEATVVVGSDDGPVRGPVTSIFDDEVVASSADPVESPDGLTSTPEAAPAAADLGDPSAPVVSRVHGVLAFSNGERLGVDRSVLIGRNPKVAGTLEDGLPHIMKFDGPGQGLSRTHAEVRIENGRMLLEDLQSTNGTEIQLPGQQRRRLRGGEPVVVVPGTLIDFGDELHCTVETAG